MSDAPSSYLPVQKSLHWLIAAIILLVMVPVGLTMTRLGEGPTTNTLYELHKSFGIIVFGLAVIRTAIRLSRGAPPLEPDIPAWQRRAAHASHYTMYVLIFLVPLTGWAATSACCPPVNLFWTVPLTLPVPANEDLAKRIFLFHYTFVFTLAAVVMVHAGAALHHHFVRRDRTLLRMLPGTGQSLQAASLRTRLDQR
ncbi:MAG TPA: cytochrome b [Beijerinckiaceae bacterium]|nr:cytochrome b [Beijerinckiaceae bacterium]